VTLLKNKWVLAVLILALSAGVFLAVASFDNASRHQSSARRGAARMADCAELVRQGGPGTEDACSSTYHREMNAADSRDVATSYMVGAAGVAGLWVLLALLYFLVRRRRTEEMPDQG